MKSTWCYILLFLLAYLPIHAQDSEKRLLWEVELQGALTNCSSWEVEPVVTFFPFKYAGISMGLLFTAPYPSTSENGITADRQLQWSSTHSNAASYLLAWRPALQLNTPNLWLGHNKEYARCISGYRNPFFKFIVYSGLRICRKAKTSFLRHKANAMTFKNLLLI